MGSGHVKGSPNAARKCYEFGHRNNRGEPCGANVIKGMTGCWKHVGKKRERAKAEGAVVVELRRLGLVGADLIDPGETLLRLVTQSAARVDLYSRLLEEAMDAAERLAASGRVPESDLLAEETARLDLERIFNAGPVAALIGHTYAGTQTSGVIATGEKIRGLADLEAQERDRCANFAAKAVAAGLAERQVRIAERAGAQMWAVLLASAAALGHSPNDPKVLSIIQAQVSTLIGRSAIEGSVAA